jgi:hypothetical protein
VAPITHCPGLSTCAGTVLQSSGELLDGCPIRDRPHDPRVVLTGVFAGWVLWPARISFTVNADLMYGELSPYRKDSEVYLLEAASGLRNLYLGNERVIEQRELVFRMALVALGVETMLWALALALALT